MLEKVVHCKKEAFDIYIGRPSIWGNPFKIGCDGTREEVIAKYREYVLSKPELLEQLESLRGKTLACWCKPLACHGDVLIELLNTDQEIVSVKCLDCEQMVPAQDCQGHPCWQDELGMRAFEERMRKKYQDEEAIEPVNPRWAIEWEKHSLIDDWGDEQRKKYPDLYRREES